VRRRTSGNVILATGIGFGLSSFLSLVALVRSQKSASFDLAVTRRIQRIDSPTIARGMNLVSWLGFRPQSLILPALSVLVAGLFSSRRDARYLVFAWAASLISYTTKLLVRRPRPGDGDGVLVVKADLRDSSFPSGHVLHYVVFWGFVAYLLMVKLAPRRWRWLPVLYLNVLIVLVGPSRVYLGHHWFTDVLGSYSLQLQPRLRTAADDGRAAPPCRPWLAHSAARWWWRTGAAPHRTSTTRWPHSSTRWRLARTWSSATCAQPATASSCSTTILPPMVCVFAGTRPLSCKARSQHSSRSKRCFRILKRPVAPAASCST
jgi:undecaprenyl-diphosphatase